MWSVGCEEKHFIFLRRSVVIAGQFLLSLILFACGAPPQQIDEGSESPALLVLSQDSTTHLPNLINGTSTLHSITLINMSATVPAERLALSGLPGPPFAFSGGQFPGLGGTCSEVLNPGNTCTMEFEITPTVSTSFQSTFQLDYFDGLEDESLEITLSGQSRDPFPAQLVLNPSSDFDFGPLAIGGFRDRVITLSNSGEMAATSINLTGLAAPFSIENNSCGTTLGAGEQCQWRVRFSPLTDSVSTDSLSLNFFDGEQNQSEDINFQGEGRIAGFLAINEGSSFDFQILLASQSSQRTLTLENTGGGNVSGISVGSMSAPFAIVSNDCPTALSPSENCEVVVSYSPTQTQLSLENLNVNYFDGFDPQQSQAQFRGQGFNNTLSLSLLSPASTPSNDDTPELQIENTIDGLRLHLYQSASCGTLNSNQTASGSQLTFEPTMAEGTYQFHVRAEDSEGNFTACSSDFVAFEYDNTPPAPPNTISFLSSYTSLSTTTPTISWSTSSSPDVVDYQVAISNSSGGGNSHGGFTSKGNVLSATQTGLSLTECEYYYASVQTEDHVGLISSSFSVSPTSFRYDSAPPSPPSSLNESGDASTTNSATVSWSAGSDACGVSHYLVAISEDLNGNNILDPGELGNILGFTDVGNITTHRFNSLSLNNGVTHFTSIKTVDTTGRESSTVTSKPWIAYDPSEELPNMIAWLDANDLATLVDSNGNNALSGSFNGEVASWRDKSDSNTYHHFNAIGSSTRPNFTPFQVNFDGSTTGLTTANHDEINTDTVRQRNLTVAFRTSNDISSRQVIYEEGGSIRGMNIYLFNNRLYCGFYNDSGGSNGDGDGNQPFVSVSRPISANTTYFVTWVFDYSHFDGADGPDGDLKCYVNGVNFDSTTTTSRLFAHSGAVGLGVVNSQTVFEDYSVANSGNNFLGSLYEVMLFNDVPTDADVVNVHTYLDNKWN